MLMFMEFNQICCDFIRGINTKPTDKLTEFDLSNINFQYRMAFANATLEPLFDFNLSDVIRRPRRLRVSVYVADIQRMKLIFMGIHA